MVSVIIPEYNGKRFVDDAISSSLNQEGTEVEIIIIDDCSSDSSYEYIQKKWSDNKKIRLYKNKVNLGFCKTANKAASLANGEFIVVLGQDDMLIDGHLKKMIRCFRADTVMVCCSCKYINENNKLIRGENYISKKKYEVKDFLAYNAISSCGAVIRKRAFEKVGGYPEFKDMPNYGEWYLWIKLAKSGTIVGNNTSYALYRRHSDNMTNGFKKPSNKRLLSCYFAICRKKARELYGGGIISMLYFIAERKTKVFVAALLNIVSEIYLLENKSIFMLKSVIFKKKIICDYRSICLYQKLDIFVRGGKYKVGKNVQFGYRTGGRYKNGYCELQSRDKSSYIEIGDNCAINNNFLAIARNRIVIGNNCRIGINCVILDFEAHGTSPEDRSIPGEIGQVLIGDNVWIGNDVTILKNVEVGNNSIIGAGAVVTKDVPANTVVGGVPASIIKKI